MIIKLLFIFLGTLSLALGIMGIVIPGLPTTPFLLLTAGLYVKSSPRLHHLLVTHKLLGAPIRRYQKDQGISTRAFFVSLFLMWITILITSIFIISPIWMKILLLGAGIIGTIAIMQLPRAKNESNEENQT